MSEKQAARADEEDRGVSEADQLQRREEALAKVVKFGDPVLKSKASPVGEFDRGLRAEIDRMIDVMRDGMGAVSYTHLTLPTILRV